MADQLRDQLPLAEKRPFDAIAEFKLSDRLPDGPRDGCIHCFLGQMARAYDAAGLRDFDDCDDGALFIHSVGADVAPRPVSCAVPPPARRAFAELWKTADPELQPKVAKVQQRLSVLRKASR